jgi:hypothetical protein
MSSRTFENDCTARGPHVAKGPSLLTKFEINPVWPIDENVVFVRMPKVFDWVRLESMLICLPRCREIYVKVWILLESKTLVTPEAAEIP